MKTLSLKRILVALLVVNLTLAVSASVGFAAQKKPVTDDAIVDQVRIKLAGDDIVKGAR